MLNLDRTQWRRVRFGDVIANVSARVDDPSSAGVERYVGLEHLDPGSMTIKRWGSPEDVAATKLLFQPGDVIFGRRRAYQKKVARADFEGICSAHAMVLRAKPEHIDPDFLPIFLSSEVFLDRAVAISVGSLSPTVNWKTLAMQEFDLPPRDQQRRIADLLWCVEDSLDREEAVLDQLRCLPQLLFDFSAEGKARGTLSDIATGFTAGASPLGVDVPAVAPQLGILKVSAVSSGRFLADENKALVDLTKFRRELHPRAGDLLVTRANANPKLVGVGCMVPEDIENLMLSDKTLRLDLLDEVPARVVLAAISSGEYRAHVEKSLSGTGAKNISQAALLAGPVPRFDETEMAALDQQLDQLSAALARQEKVLDNLRRLRGAQLMSKAPQ